MAAIFKMAVVKIIEILWVFMQVLDEISKIKCSTVIKPVIYITSDIISMKNILVKLKLKKMRIFKMAVKGVTMWRKYGISQKTFQVTTKSQKYFKHCIYALYLKKKALKQFVI